MKFNILQQDLLPALQAVSRSAGFHSTLPVLSNLLLSVSSHNLKISTTNLEIGVIKNLPADILEPGDITVPAKTITELVLSIGPVKLEFLSEGDTLNISAGKFKAKINGISATEFPVIPTSNQNPVNFKRKILEQIQQVLFAAAADEGRPTLTGILTQSASSKLDFVATDGFRLAHRQVSVGKEVHFKSLIPKRTFEEVLRVLTEEAVEEVSISTSKDQNQVIFQIGGTMISSRLIEGNFPAWEKIIPEDIKTRIIVEKENLLQAIKLASVFAKGEANIVTLNPLPSKLVVTSEAKEVGQQENEIESEVSGENFPIAFNVKFLTDILQSVSSTQVLIELSGALSASLIKPVGLEGLEYILMPVRTS